MSPDLALWMWLVLLAALLWFDPAKEKGTSPALWVPVIWMLIVGTRLPSQWLSGSLGGGLTAQTLQDGNPLDRVYFCAMILAAVAILISRGFRWGEFFRQNAALFAFVTFALMSVIWSDFHFITFKRWFRDLGNYIVILVALTDRRPLQAISTVFRRLSYLLIPLSIVLVKYFPLIGVQWDFWTGTAMYSGPTTSKNGLGCICLISGLYFFWDTLNRWAARRERRTKKILLVNAIFFVMTVWLLNIANSATSRSCTILGCLIIAAAQSRFFRRHSSVLKIGIPVFVVLYPLLAFGFNMTGEFAKAVGRDPTFTGRTEIWKVVLSMKTNPLLGVGYDSFWLGPRLEWLWTRVGMLNETHNGFIEIYVTLGLIGTMLLGALAFATFRTVCRRLTPFTTLGSLSLAIWTIFFFYNMTESAIKGHYMWVTFLLVLTRIPSRRPAARQSAQTRDTPAMEIVAA